MKRTWLKNISLMIIAFCMMLSIIVLPAGKKDEKIVQGATIEKVALNNQDFKNYTTQVDSTAGYPSGFMRLEGMNSSATNRNLIAGIVNTENTKYNEDYKAINPQPAIPGSDTFLLMINSQNTFVSMGYRSSSVPVEHDSYFKFSVWVWVNNANASVYLANENETDENKRIFAQMENIGMNRGWHEYVMFVHGNEIKTTNVVMELWLGTNGGTINDSSSGVVYFDNISVQKLSADIYHNELTTEMASRSDFVIETNLTDLREASIDETTAGYNFGFEQYNENKFDNWKVADGSIVPTQIGVEQTFGHDDVDVTLGKNGFVYKSIPSQVLLFNTTDGYGKITSEEFIINRYESYYLSVFVKASAAYISGITVEQTKFLVNGEEKNKTASKESLSADVNVGENNSVNKGWIRYHFIINGHSLYDCAVTVSLNIGKKDSPVKGYVAFDDLSLTKIDNGERTLVNGLTNVSNFSLEGTKTQAIPNGAFNGIKEVVLSDKLEANLPKTKDAKVAYPIADVTSWEHGTYETTKDSLKYGIVNTNPIYFDEGNVNGSYGGATNPGLKNGVQLSSTTNNVLMLTNTSVASQYFKSEEFHLAAYSYNRITLLANRQSATGNAYINVVEGDNVIASIAFAETSGWQRFDFYIKTSSVQKSVQLVLGLGTKDADGKANGTVYFDDIELIGSLDVAYNAAVATNYLVKKDLSYELFDGIYSNLAGSTYLKDASPVVNFTGAGNTTHGIYNINDENVPSYLRNSPNSMLAPNVLYLNNKEFTYSSMSLKSMYSFTASEYYRLLIYVKINNIEAEDELLENPMKKFGLEISLNGIAEKFEGIKGTTDGFMEYAFYIPADENVEATLTFTLGTEANKVMGEVLISHIKLEKFDSAEEYDESLFASQSSMDENKKFVNVATVIPAETTPSEPQLPTDTTPPTLEDLWYLFPTIVMGIVLIIVIFAVMFRQVSKKQREAAELALGEPLTAEEEERQAKRNKIKGKLAQIIFIDEERLDELEAQEREGRSSDKPNKVAKFFEGVITEDKKVPPKRKK